MTTTTTVSATNTPSTSQTTRVTTAHTLIVNVSISVPTTAISQSTKGTPSPPVVNTTTTLPVLTTTTTTLPVVKPSPPVTTTTTLPPVVNTTTLPPVVNTTTTLPVVKPSPPVTTTTTFPQCGEHHHPPPGGDDHYHHPPGGETLPPGDNHHHPPPANDCQCNGAPCEFNLALGSCQCRCADDTYGETCVFGNNETVAVIGTFIVKAVVEYNYPNNDAQIQTLNTELGHVLTDIFNDTSALHAMAQALGPDVTVGLNSVRLQGTVITRAADLKPYVSCRQYANYTAELSNGSWKCVGACRTIPGYCHWHGECRNHIEAGPVCRKPSDFEEDSFDFSGHNHTATDSGHRL
ncbi:hypothetical protein NHX12_029610 [Muraenolepis orangiensis]|uniref:Uncharacterized protein n=1 Tax=Muraenolepis orangiensis TaxID=630683 RepID=A0A9Q0EA73_9TELE|nr:hypothetical protein NHX12_029610 [Muraenolepis orangiensis]